MRVGALAAAHPAVAELDLNPVIATPDGALVVDARVRLERPGAPPRVPVAQRLIRTASPQREDRPMRSVLDPVDLDAECADRGRQSLVVADEQAQFDRLAVAETRLDGAPRRIREPPFGEQFVGDSQQRPLTLGEAARRRIVGHARDLVGRQPYAQRDRHVLLPLVCRAALPRDPQDHQLGVAPRQLTERHQVRRVAQPGAEQARVSAERREDVRGAAAADARRRARPRFSPAVVSSSGRAGAMRGTPPFHGREQSLQPGNVRALLRAARARSDHAR